MGTLSQSDYTGVACKSCTQGLFAQGLCVQGWWGHSVNQITGVRARVVHAGVAHKGCMLRGCMQGLRVQGLHTQRWSEHSANQITQGLRARVKGTLSQSDYMQGLHMQGLHAGVMSAGVACTVGPSLFVLGYHWLPLPTIDLVGDNREFEV